MKTEIYNKEKNMKKANLLITDSYFCYGDVTILDDTGVFLHYEYDGERFFIARDCVEIEYIEN